MSPQISMIEYYGDTVTRIQGHEYGLRTTDNYSLNISSMPEFGESGNRGVRG